MQLTCISVFVPPILSLIEPKMSEVDEWQKSALKNQIEMVEALKILNHGLDQLHTDLEKASEKLEVAVTKLGGAMWGLLKVPVACVIVGAASWAFLYAKAINEHTWIIIMGVAVFPWLGDSISAIAQLFGLGRQNPTNGGDK